MMLTPLLYRQPSPAHEEEISEDRTDQQLVRKALPVKFTGGISGSKSLYVELEKLLIMRVSISTADIALRAAELAR